MGKMQWSIRKGQRATIAAGIAVAVFACAREFDVIWRYGLWIMDLETHVLAVEDGMQSTDIWMYGPTVALNLKQNGSR